MTERPAITLCNLESADYPAILALWLRAGLPVRPTGRDAPDAFARQMTTGLQRVIGLRAGDRLVGVAVLTHDGRKGWINRLAIDPEYRRLGLGSLLVEESERWFHDDLGLEVYAALIEGENVDSQALMAHLGYTTHDVLYVSKRARPEA